MGTVPALAGLTGAATVAAWVGALAGAFAEAGIPGARRDARLLVAHAGGLDATAMIADPECLLEAAVAARLQAMARRRLAGEPVSRIIGRREFWGLEFEIAPVVLDPRPDTETLVEAMLQVAAIQVVAEKFPTAEISTSPRRLRLLDLGTGSGAILLAVLSEIGPKIGRGKTSDVEAVGLDCCPNALQIARANAERLGLAEHCRFIETDWWSARQASEQHLIDGAAFDIIVSNPPYIPTEEIARLAPEVSRHDPFVALDGGADGLAAYREIIPGAAARLRPGGWLLFEVGAGQAQCVQRLLVSAGFEAGLVNAPEPNQLPNQLPGQDQKQAQDQGPVGVRHDLAGIARCTIARWPVRNSAANPASGLAADQAQFLR